MSSGNYSSSRKDKSSGEKPLNSGSNFRQIFQEISIRHASRRKITDRVVSIIAIVFVIGAIIPLASILFEVIKNGIAALSVQFLTQPPGSIGSDMGGIGPAIQGTLITVGLASLIGAPIGVLSGVYLSEFAPTGSDKGVKQRAISFFATIIRLFNDVLTGLPSIVIGIVGYVTIVLALNSFSVLAGAFALSIIMIPIVSRVTEETLKLVPNSFREAGYSLGISKAKITLFIVLKNAKDGVLTGVILAISRIAGETAPLIMTILGTSLFFTGLTGPVDALPLRIWRLASQPYESAHAFGWGAALVLILMILALSATIRLIARGKGVRVRTETI